MPLQVCSRSEFRSIIIIIVFLSFKNIQSFNDGYAVLLLKMSCSTTDGEPTIATYYSCRKSVYREKRQRNQIRKILTHPLYSKESPLSDLCFDYRTPGRFTFFPVVILDVIHVNSRMFTLSVSARLVFGGAVLFEGAGLTLNASIAINYIFLIFFYLVIDLLYY